MSSAISRMLGKRKVEAATVPQSQPMEEDQRENSAGGWVWEVTPESRVRRFLCLGTEGGSYYQSEAELTLENAKACVEMLEAGEGLRLVELVREMSVSGRCAKQQPTLFALALAARCPAEAPSRPERSRVAAAAYAALPDVARIPTHLFLFADFAEAVGRTSGWGRAHRAAIARWYLAKEPRDLAFAITKYPQRGGWAHRDLLRLAHPKAKNAVFPEDLSEEGRAARVAEMDRVLAYATHGQAGLSAKVSGAPEAGEGGAVELLDAVETLKGTEWAQEAADLIRRHRLAREHVPTQLLNEREVWAALFPSLGLTALLRNLPKLTNVGLLGPKREELKAVTQRLTDEEGLRKARVHPFAVLLAHETYKAGRGDKGKQAWEPVPAVVQALDAAFYKAFHNVPSTEKRYLVALDVSGSMCSPILGARSLTARVASAAMALLHLRTETSAVDLVAFQDKLTKLSFPKTARLEDVVGRVSGLAFGATDCALPMEWARKQRKDYDVFVVYTDSETWFGKVHPAEALRKYRRERVREAKLIVVAMTANKISIADPKDPGMLDIAGFDAAAPELMRNFVMGLV